MLPWTKVEENPKDVQRVAHRSDGESAPYWPVHASLASGSLYLTLHASPAFLGVGVSSRHEIRLADPSSYAC